MKTFYLLILALLTSNLASQQLIQQTSARVINIFEDGTIDCSKNKPGCKRDLCLCDKEFAETVATHEVTL